MRRRERRCVLPSAAPHTCWLTVLGGVLMLTMALRVAADAALLEAAITAYDRGDVVEAMTLFRRAAEAGDPEAQTRLAYILDMSELDDEARAWYQRAADAGYPPAQFGLAEMLLTGNPSDIEGAKTWLLESAARDYLPAVRAAARHYGNGTAGFPVDPVLSRAWIKRAAEAGDGWAIKQLEQLESETQ